MSSEDIHQRSATVNAGKIEAETGVQVNVNLGEGRRQATDVRSNIKGSWLEKPWAGREATFGELDTLLGARSRARVVVLTGGPGHGKSHLAVRYALERRSEYPGGVFLFKLGHSGPPTELGPWNLCAGTPAERWASVLAGLGSEPTLVIYDDVVTQDYVERWGPRVDQALHILATTTLDYDGTWPVCRVLPLKDEDARKVARVVLGEELFASEGEQLVMSSGGLALELVLTAGAMKRAKRHGLALPGGPHAGTDGRFEEAWELLTGPGRRVLERCAMYEPTRLPVEKIVADLGDEGRAGWVACLEQSLVEPEGQMHGLLSSFVRRRCGAIEEVRARIVEEFVEAAHRVEESPGDSEAATKFGWYFGSLEVWEEMGLIGALEGELEVVGAALVELGRFAEAQPWLERVVAAVLEGDIHGRVDHDSLGESLHQVGYCLSEQGQYALAQDWYERAVAATEQGDIQGRVDHDSLGRSLHQVGYCLSEQGEYALAQDWYERAVAAVEQGDVDGRIDHDNLSRSLGRVGGCLAEKGEYVRAQDWYERAVVAAEQGDIHGRVNYESLGGNFHHVGYCLFQQGEHALAQGWFERAVAAAEQGDIHGRINHESLGSSLHQVGYCLSEQGEYALAQDWYERAVVAAEQGDIHGRVDHNSLGKSLGWVGGCLSEQGKYALAQDWYERAVAAKERGDIHGRIDHDSLASSLHQVGYCLSQQGKHALAQGWYEKAVAAAEEGDVYGRVDQSALAHTLMSLSACHFMQWSLLRGLKCFGRSCRELLKNSSRNRALPES